RFMLLHYVLPRSPQSTRFPYTTLFRSPVEVIRPFGHRVFADGGSTQERGLESGRKSLPRFRNGSAHRPTVAPARFSHRARQRKTALVGEVRSFLDRPLRHPGRTRPEDRPHVAGESK